eukprot:tig00021761_g23438.t1
MPPRRRGRKKKPESESEGSAYEEEEEKPESESEEEVEEEEAEDEPKPKGKRGKKMKEKKYNELDMPIVEIPKRAVLVEGENGQIIEMQKGIPDVVKILEDPITRVQVPETTALDAYYKDATFWSIHSKQFYDALPEERLRAIPRAFQSAQNRARLLPLPAPHVRNPEHTRKKGTAEAVAERPRRRRPPAQEGDTTAVSAQAQNQMAQTVLGGPKPKASKSAKDMAAASASRPSRRDRRDLRKSTEVRENIEKTKTGLQAARANGLEALEKVITEINETVARLAQVLSDAEFYKFIRFNLKEEDGKYKDDTFANAIIGIRVQGGVEVGPTDGCLHAHVLVTIDHISNLQVLWAKYDWVVVLKEKEPDPPTILAELIPEENYGGRLQEYPTKTLPETQRRDLLKQWSHARNQNNTDNNTDGYLFSIFQTESAPSTIRASRR